MRLSNASIFLMIVSFVASFIASQPARADDDWPAGVASIDVTDSKRAPDQSGQEERHYTLHVEDHGVYELSYTTAADKDAGDLADIRFWELEHSQEIYSYKPLGSVAVNYFFPVFEPGDYHLQLYMRGVKAGQSFAFKVHRYDVTVTDALQAQARAALDRGMAFLENGNAKVDLGSSDLTDDESLVVMSYVSSNDPKYRPYVEQKYLPALAANWKESDPEIWNGHSVHGLIGDQFGYRHSIATLALAEIAQTYNNAQAKTMAAQGAECLLAAQDTEKKSKKWNGPILSDVIHYGGWRYTADADAADISVSGWCTVALIATASSDIKVDGLRDSLYKAVRYIQKLGAGPSYGYQNPDSNPSDVHAGIGTLIMKLYGEESPSIEEAASYLDSHLYPGVQCHDGEAYPLYFAYYATRANYLRGGFAWEAWRNTMIRQLLNLQNPDGSWQVFGSEHNKTRYGAAMATMILRMCLNQVPNYLKQEVRGF